MSFDYIYSWANCIKLLVRAESELGWMVDFMVKP